MLALHATPSCPRYFLWKIATAQPGEVPGAWLWKADWVVFQPPVHPGGGMSVLDGAAKAPTGRARARTVAPAAAARRMVRCMVDLSSFTGPRPAI